MRDDDKMMDLPPEFGSGVIGVCDICGTRQAVIVLSKERYKLCVIDFLNKTWIQSEKTPGAPLPLYRSERIWFETDATPDRRAPAIRLVPTKTVRHPIVLVVPDVYGITTTLLDAAIRFAREGFEVLIPDIGKTAKIGVREHLTTRAGAHLRGGVDISSKPVARLIRLHQNALDYLRAREMVDAAKSAVFGTSYGASLALAVAAQDVQLGAAVLAYPAPTRPAGLATLVTAPILFVDAPADSVSQKALAQLTSGLAGSKASFQVAKFPGARHDFLSRDLPTYDLPIAEAAWSQIVAFLKRVLMAPPPRPPAPMLRSAPPPVPTTATEPAKAPPPAG